MVAESFSTNRGGGAPLPGGWIAQIAPFAILAATAAYLQFRWNDIPARFPVHWAVDGEPNGWSTSTPIGVFGPLLLGFVVLLVVLASSYASRRLGHHAPSTPLGVVAHDLSYRMSVFLLVLEFFLAIIFSLVGLLPLTGSPGVMPILVITGAFFASLIFIIAWVGKGQTHRAQHAAVASHTGAPVAQAAPEEVWKLGMFYCNPEDKSLWVAKRIGIGYTLNFAHPSAWIFMAVVLLLPVVMLLFIFHQR